MTAAPAPARRFAALQHRDFQVYWVGQAVSLLGTQIQRVAVAWQVYLLTHSPVKLGLLGLFRALPILLFALGGGVVADAVDRRRLMILTQSLLAAASVALALLTVSGHVSVDAIYAITFLSGCASAFDGPARQALVSNLVPAEDLPNALSLNVTSWQVASVAGPALGGLLLAAGGLASAYAVDALSFLAVIGALIAMQHRSTPAPEGRVSLGAALEGLRFVRGQPVILGMMLVDFVGTFFADASMLLPIFAAEVFHRGELGLGALNSARAVGAVAAAVVVTWLPPIRARGKVVLTSVAIYGLTIAGFGLSTSYALSLALLAASGAADTVSMVVRQTVRQLLTPDAMRGRMTSVNMIFFVGGPQLGEVEAGALARFVGAPLAVLCGGIACALFAGGVALGAPAVRRHRA